MRPDLRQEDAGARAHPHRPRRAGPAAPAAAGAPAEHPAGGADAGGHRRAAAAREP